MLTAGKYILPLDRWRFETRGDAAITVFHETIPGHHLQRALARQMQHTGDIFKLSFNSAYIEGWALFYMLGEEEKKIRKNPAAQTTALLKEVFGRK